VDGNLTGKFVPTTSSSSLPSTTLLSTGFTSLSAKLPLWLERSIGASVVALLTETGAVVGAVGESGISIVAEHGKGGKGNINGSFESLSEEGVLHKSFPVLEIVPVTAVVAFMLEGAVNVAEQEDALREDRSLLSRSLMPE
jgi:hypothetical protein